MRAPHIPEPRIDPTALVAPSAAIYGNVTIGPGVFVLFGVVIRAELDAIEIGARSNVQDNAVLHCDEGVPCIVGERVTIGHSAVVHGARVDDHALVGIGATALNRSYIGAGAWLAAGSVLTEGSVIPPWTLAMGTPARAVRELTMEERQRAAEGVEHYLELAAAYRELLR